MTYVRVTERVDRKKLWWARWQLFSAVIALLLVIDAGYLAFYRHDYPQATWCMTIVLLIGQSRAEFNE
jgi:hypothetical protein